MIATGIHLDFSKYSGTTVFFLTPICIRPDATLVARSSSSGRNQLLKYFVLVRTIYYLAHSLSIVRLEILRETNFHLQV